MTLFTLGYQGLTVASYVAALEAAGAGVVLDVREVPWSRKPGFSKSPLAAALDAAGIEYLHVKSAGNPASIRKREASSAEVLDAYREHLRRNPDAVDELLAHIRGAAGRGRAACLTCFERLPAECHRSILVEALLARDPSLEVTHLDADRQLPLL
jgi:uncharacterized protein (DUF488 family)